MLKPPRSHVGRNLPEILRTWSEQRQAAARLIGWVRKGELARVGRRGPVRRLSRGSVAHEALVQEPLRVAQPSGPKGLHDLPPCGQAHDGPVREGVVVAAELEERTVDEPDVRQARLDPAEEIERGGGPPPRPEAAAARLGPRL